ncbi:hypothetical protein [Natronococcus jeotgali]|uniref:Uncharacterized protein n=1 Tax=Natronococcus jeotgali DSM 18795 TaxID=1227498 RepID=L9XB77_9EURY|nr:hypothetical protein [Natronococcus jeotgali]ELY57873.1 hypothetical protein C492_13164 [Natronococcus jeotgali DSM 18795]
MRDGDVVHATSHGSRAAREFDGVGQYDYGALLYCEWGRTPGDYAVRVRLDDDCVLVDATLRGYDSSLWIRLEGVCNREDAAETCAFVR